MDESIFLNQLKHATEVSSVESELSLPNAHLKRLLAVAEKYRTLYEIGKLIASEMEIEALLRLAMDEVLAITRAERGFIALVEDDHRLDFRAARNIEKKDVEQPRFHVSRSIIQRVLAEGKVVCLPDALTDGGFGAIESVRRLQLLSVLCTPLIIRERVAGVIYVDNTNVKYLFDEMTAELLTRLSQLVATALQNACVFTDLKKSQQQLASELRARFQFDAIIGSGPAMTKILQIVADVADTDSTILIRGENGTGKDLIARALHYNSRRRDHPFVAINCGAIPEALIESELFGHEKGAFTSAVIRRQGKFELAHGGTIFLDEIGEMTLPTQVKLLRVLQECTFAPVGSNVEKYCDVRVIAATNRDLKKMMAQATFREDLYYRLNVIDLHVPPLRDRREDILLLIDHFLRKHNKQEKLPRLSKPVEQLLLDFGYPGNVRQLDNIIQRAVIFSKGGTIEVQHLPEEVQNSAIYHEHDEQGQATFQQRKHRAIEKFEREELIRILTLTGGKVRESARIAGMYPANFSDKLQQYGLKADDFKTGKKSEVN
ncbi:MAG: sigma 54-interacting transcriptional regulator [bacterium]